MCLEGGEAGAVWVVFPEPFAYLSCVASHVHLQVDAATGLCQIFDQDGTGTWAVDRMTLHVYVDSDGQRLLYTGLKPVGNLEALRAQHQIAEAVLVRSPGLDKVSIQVCL